jgi:ankyrin repeat protein
VTKHALDDLRQQDRFFDLIQKGGDKDIPLLQRELDRDPKRHFYDRSNPAHLINKTNRLNQTPLYLACRNGNLAVVTFLLRQQADPHILSNIHNDDKESPLDVAVRWDHKKIVEFLLENVQWTEDEIKRTIKQEDINLELQRILRAYSKRRFNCFFNFCLCA